MDPLAFKRDQSRQREGPAGALPALLLPVRLETRFGGRPETPELWIRVYPDQISIDTHDPRLTTDEIALTKRYWETVWRAGSAAPNALPAWRALAQRFGATRAAYLAHTPLLAPTNPADRPTTPVADGAPLTPPPAFPTVATADRRTASWARPPRALGLPERLTFVLMRGGEAVHREVGAPIPTDLVMGPNPNTVATPTTDGLRVDNAMLWMVDFERALEVGMAARITITPRDRAEGFDSLLVYGLRAATPAARGAAIVRSIVDSHRFTDGFALVPQGSPTNNTEAAPAAYTRADPGFERSFAIVRTDQPTPRDGAVLALALGLDAGALQNVEHAARNDQGNARWMSVALWPAAMGYFLEQMMSEVVTSAGREAARSYYLDNVRGRGLLPTIRCGDTPYGVLQTTSLALLDTGKAAPVARDLSEFARRALPIWAASVEAVPHVTAFGDPDAQLVGVLGIDASARGYRARHALGEEFTYHAGAWLDVGKDRDYFIDKPAKDQLARLGYTTWDPRLARLAMTYTDRDVPFPIVVDGPVSETAGLPPVDLPDATTGNYISWLRRASWADIQGDAHRFPGGTPPKALLYKVLRQALLTEFGKLAFGILVRAELVDAAVLREPELVGFPSYEREHPTQGARPTVWEALEHQLPGTEKAISIGDHIAVQASARAPGFSHLSELLDALDALAGLPTAELERLFTETLDTFSHRLDTWITSLAVERERRRRPAQPDVHVGAYGWLEQLRAKQQPAEATGVWRERVDRVDALRHEHFPAASTLRPARVAREDSGGFIHAPSLSQAAVGAVLRNGYLTHTAAGNAGGLAIDLSSARVRVALELLDGVRQGQPLPALLGYRFERGLAEQSLQVLIQPYRDRFPIVANKLTQPVAPAEAVAARSVVDGSALRDAWRSGTLWNGEPTLDTVQRAAVEALARDLDDALDALGDVSISESVYQILAGNPVRAGGLLDAVSRGERAAEPTVTRTPRAGTDVTHRIALLFTPGQTRRLVWPGATHPRARAEPTLDAWASHALPDPAQVRCRVTYRRGSSTTDLDVTLADLNLGPLDALALAPAADQPQRSEIEQRLLYDAAAAAPPDAEAFELHFEHLPGWGPDDIGFHEFLVAARALADLLGGARSLGPRDLIEPERDPTGAGAAIDNAELKVRAGSARAELDAAIAALTGAATASDLRARLLQASLLGPIGAIPVSAHGSDPTTFAALQAQRDSVVAELRKRATADDGVEAGFDLAHARPEQLRDHLVERLRAALGQSFTVCPRFTPPDAAALAAAFAATNALLGGDRDAPARWIAQLEHVRAGVARWTAARDLAQLLARQFPVATLIAQLPVASPDRWLGLPFDSGLRPKSGKVAILTEVHPGYSPTAPHSGLLLDEWAERIPAAEQTTGVAFHYDQPSARAPQTILLAVCPDERQTWDEQAMEAVLTETLALAKIRAVDLDSLSELGQLLPTLFFPFNADGDTVSLDFYDIR
jgi:hypothetical protein